MCCLSLSVIGLCCKQIPVTIEDASVYPQIESAFSQAGYVAVEKSIT